MRGLGARLEGLRLLCGMRKQVSVWHTDKGGKEGDAPDDAIRPKDKTNCKTYTCTHHGTHPVSTVVSEPGQMNVAITDFTDKYSKTLAYYPCEHQ